MGKASRKRAKSKTEIAGKAVKNTPRGSKQAKSKKTKKAAGKAARKAAERHIKKAAKKSAKKSLRLYKETKPKAKKAIKELIEEAPEQEHRGLTAEDMALQQRDISVAEFFIKNRHLLGFDNPRKALLTTIKEGVDNALDACEEGGILPEVSVVIAPGKEENRFVVTIEDNGPGIDASLREKVFEMFFTTKTGGYGMGLTVAQMYMTLQGGYIACERSRNYSSGTTFILGFPSN